MILYDNSDSHTKGAELNNNDKSFVTLVAEHFNLQEINQAKGGGSNHRVVRTTKKWIENNKNYFVLIGWSTWEREEWLIDETYYQINASGTVSIPDSHKQRYKEYISNQSYQTMLTKGTQWNEIIWKFHNELNQNNVKHLFFNTFLPCIYSDAGRARVRDRKYINDWGVEYISPYDSNLTYHQYLINAGYRHISDRNYHYAQDGHQEWANFLINHIEEHNLL